MSDGSRMTAVFDFDLRKYQGNPHNAETPFGRPVVLSVGDEIAALTAERDALALQVQRAREEYQAALCVLHDCMVEIDDYIKQEYPSDHPVHERYRARDFAANPARMFLKDRIKETLDARALRGATQGAGG
jgi:hypothetical protein